MSICHGSLRFVDEYIELPVYVDLLSRNRDDIMKQKLAELVTEIYLCTSARKRDGLWERVRKALTNLKVEPAVVEDLVARHDVKALAELVGANG